LRAIERRFLVAIQAMVFGGVILLTVGAGMLSWSHLTHVAATNGHIAPARLLFVFPTIVDGFMVLGSAVVMRHAIADKIGGRTWYAGALVAATATLSICSIFRIRPAVRSCPRGHCRESHRHLHAGC
jgi:hypothetical protein